MSNIPGPFSVTTSTQTVVTISIVGDDVGRLVGDLRTAVGLLGDRATPEEDDFRWSADRLDDLRDQLERSLRDDGTR